MLAQRITFVGELGWELYAPPEFAPRLWDELWQAGRGHGMRAGGYRAIDSLRLEKGYRVWGTDITPDVTPDEAGLGFAVAIDKPGGFLGRGIAYAYLPASVELGVRVTVGVFDESVGAEVTREPLSDPGNDRVLDRGATTVA